MPRILAIVLATGVAGPRTLHAQEPAVNTAEYTAARADADLQLIQYATGELYDAAHARLMAHPELALTRLYLQIQTPAEVTASERERLATMAEALAGAEARAQIMNAPLQIVPDPQPPTTPSAPPSVPPPTTLPPPSPPPADTLELPGRPKGDPDDWKPITVAGMVFLGAGGVVGGIGIKLVHESIKSPEESQRCGCGSVVGGGLIAGGVIFAGAGMYIISEAIKHRRAWRAYEARHAVKLAPSIGRSAPGTWTAGLSLRF